MFVTLDGPNGVGKTSVALRLAEALTGQGHDVVSLKQPSASELGTFARRSEQSMSGLPYAAVVVADRYQMMESDVGPALAAGRTVLCDRHVASTLVLQRFDEVPLDLLWALNSQVLVPDLSVLLLAKPDTISARLDARGRVSRFEKRPDVAEREVQYFEEAFELLSANGYRTLTLRTDNRSAPECAAMIVEQMSSLGG